jgi:hypothetical protein
MESTSPRALGGKTPWPSWPGRLLQSRESLRERPGAPQAHRMAITAHLGGKPEMRRVIGGCSPHDQPTTERQRVRRGMRADEGLHLGLFLCY